MTDAQAAIIAAAIMHNGAGPASTAAIKQTATEFLGWLQQKKTEIRVG